MKKKAIKIAAASAVAASSFVAVAPYTTEAASNVSSSVNKAVKDAKKAQDTYINSAKKGKNASSKVVENRAKAAKKSISAAKKLVNKEKDKKKKAAYNKKLKTAQTYVDRADSYVKGVRAAAATKKNVDKVKAAVKRENFKNFDKVLDNLDKDIKASQKDVNKVYNASARKVLKSKYITPFKKAQKDAKVAYDAFSTEAAVESVSAINTTSAKVTFTKAIEDELKASDFTVANKATGEKQVVKSVKLSDDKTSATVEFYSPVAANTTYTVAVNVGEDTVNGELVIGSLTPTKIDIENQVVKSGDSIEYTLLSAQGIELADTDLTDGQTVEVVSSASQIDEDGKVTLDVGTSAKAKVVVKDKDGKTIVESKEVTISVAAPKLSSISVVTTGEGTIDKPSTTIYGTSGNLSVQFKDQFDTPYTQAELEDTTGTGTFKDNEYKVSFESQNLGVAVVDKTTGAVTALGTGTVPVKVSVTDKDGKVVLSKTVVITIKATPAVDKVTVDKSSVLLSLTADDSQTVKVSLEDQYGDAIDVEPTVKVYKNEEQADDELDVDTKQTDDGEYEVTVSTNVDTKAATYTVEVTAGDKKVSFKVTAKEAGEATSYVLKGVSDTFDLKDGNLADIKPALYTADAEGLTVAEVDLATFKVTGNNKVKVEAGEIVLADNNKPLTAGETFTVEIYTGLTKAASKTVKVIDTTPVYTADFTGYTLTATAGDTLAEAISENLFVFVDGEKQEGFSVATTDDAVTFVTTDSTVVDPEDGTLAKGTATVIVSAIDVVGTFDGDPVSKTIEFSTPVKFTVKVAAGTP